MEDSSLNLLRKAVFSVGSLNSTPMAIPSPNKAGENFTYSLPFSLNLNSCIVKKHKCWGHADYSRVCAHVLACLCTCMDGI